MPRHTNPEVETRIIAAARKLWHAGGEEALSMRAIARVARTNTPAVYRRFRDRDEIVRALVTMYQAELLREVEPATSLLELVKRVLQFGLQRPREYQLMSSGVIARVSKSRPSLDLATRKVSSWFGGTPEENRNVVTTLWAMTHGLIMLRIAGSMREEEFPRAVAALHHAVEVLVENRQRLNGTGK